MTNSIALAMHSAAAHRLARQKALGSVGPGEIDDLTQDALVALLEMNVKPGMSEKQQRAHAAQRITGALIDSLRSRDHCTRSIRTKGRDIARARARLAQQLGREPRPSEIAVAANIDIAEYFAVMRGLHGLGVRAESLEEVDAIDEAYLIDRTGNEFDDPADKLSAVQVRDGLREAIRALPVRHRYIVSSMLESRTMLQIARELDITESRVCQQYKESVRMLRLALQRRGLL